MKIGNKKKYKYRLHLLKTIYDKIIIFVVYVPED